MGDRANVQFAHRNGTINLYAHWHGPNLAAAVVREMNEPIARARWSDPSYFTRIVIHRVLDALADPNSETGFGLGCEPDDNQYPILVLDTEARTFHFIEGGGMAEPDMSGTYEDLVALGPERVAAIVASG
jgi:hypothetical protein